MLRKAGGAWGKESIFSKVAGCVSQCYLLCHVDLGNLTAACERQQPQRIANCLPGICLCNICQWEVAGKAKQDFLSDTGILAFSCRLKLETFTVDSWWGNGRISLTSIKIKYVLW